MVTVWRPDQHADTHQAFVGQPLVYSQWHTTALCSPTRSCFLTGRNHHQNGFASISENASGFPGYNSHLRLENAPMAKVLRDAGWSSGWRASYMITTSFRVTVAAAGKQNNSAPKIKLAIQANSLSCTLEMAIEGPPRHPDFFDSNRRGDPIVGISLGWGVARSRAMNKTAVAVAASTKGQNFTTEDLARRTIERRAVEAVTSQFSQENSIAER